MNPGASVILGTYDYAVVAMSILVAFLGSFAALDLAGRLRGAPGGRHGRWIVAAAVAQGIAIWSMHYTGMLAFHLPIPTRYDWRFALLSFLIAMSVAAGAVHAATQKFMDRRRIVLAGIVMGIAIVGQHYTAMASVRTGAAHVYSVPRVALSAVFACVFSVLSLWLMFRLPGSVGGVRVRQTAGAFQMATAICLMHYTGMSAVTFSGTTVEPDWSHAIPITAYGVTAIGACTLAAVVVIIFTSLWDEHRRGAIDRKDAFDQLRALAAGLERAREDERTRVSREIHDELGQALTSINLELASLARDLPAPVRGRAESLRRLVDDTIRDVRRIATDLRPGVLDDLGLAAAVEWAADEFQRRSGTRVYLQMPDGDINMEAHRATALFRILQEAFTNIARHAGATEVHVRLAQEGDDVTLEVRDNGRGLNHHPAAAGGSLGIVGMRERAVLLGGTFTIEGAATRGTIVRTTIPVRTLCSI